MPNLIQNIISKNIHDESTIFVFPTQTAADLWADRTTLVTDVSAVSMDRFLAWDDFKGKSIRTQQKDKTSIPSTMRKIFADMLIAQNAQEPFLKDLIPVEYASEASGFSSWLASTLPSLKLWKNYFDKKTGGEPDQEDLDLEQLYNRYSDFLSQHNFFDPAWEEPPFTPDGNRYIVFFPEILSDYMEYKNILTQSPESITVVNLPEQDASGSNGSNGSCESNSENESSSEELPSVRFYSNSRAELRNTALFIRQLHEEKKIPWDQIAVSVPDMESYGAYIERELSIYHIPYVSRNAKPLSSSEPGALFGMISECSSDGFSFGSLKSLLLNKSLPWKNTNLIDQLIEFGIQNNCICSYDDGKQHHDVWEESFSNPTERYNTEQLPSFYKKLKSSMKAIVNSVSFEEIRDLYFKFRNEFLDMDSCTEQADRILSRCITELGALIDLEKEYPECKVSKPYSFFVKSLADVNYLEQTDSRGVQVLPYKLSAAAPFECQVIVDASQSSTSIVYKQLSFLRDDKRAKLDLQETNVSQNFVRLYVMNSLTEKAFFACGERTFNGYSQPSSYLETKDCRPTSKEYVPESFGTDPYEAEKNYLSGKDSNVPQSLFETSITGFNQWAERENYDSKSVDENAQTQIARILSERLDLEKGFTFSKTQLDKFYKCPRYWLFKQGLNLKDEDNEAELIDEYAIGNLNHAILQIFCNSLRDRNLELKATSAGLSEEYKTILLDAVDRAIEESDNSHLAKQLIKIEKSFVTKNLYDSVVMLSKIFFGCKVESTEVKCLTQQQSASGEKNDMMIGYYDCLLRDQQSDEYFLLDFKTSKAPKNIVLDESVKDGEIDFQMPMYVTILEGEHTENDKEAKTKTIANAGFFIIKDSACIPVFGENLKNRINEYKSSRGKIQDLIDRKGFEPTIEKFRTEAELFAHRIHNLDFSISPEAQDFSTCNSCEHKAICRRTFNVGRKE